MKHILSQSYVKNKQAMCVMIVLKMKTYTLVTHANCFISYTFITTDELRLQGS